MRQTGGPFASKLVFFPGLLILRAGVGHGPDGEALVGRRSGFRRSRNEFRLRSWEHGAEFAGGEGVQSAEAVGKFGGGYAALAAEGAEKIVGGGFAFLGVALGAAGDEVAVRVLSSAGERDDVVEAAGARGELGQAVEAEAAVARMNGRAARFRSQEIRLLDAGGAWTAGEATRHRSVRSGGVNLVWQKNLDHVARAGAFEEAKSALLDESTHRLARGSFREPNAAGEPLNGKAEPELAFKAGVAQEMIIDHALNEIEAQARDELVFDLFPDEQGIEFFVFHGWRS